MAEVTESSENKICGGVRETVTPMNLCFSHEVKYGQVSARRIFLAHH